MGWASFDVVRFDLGPLLQGQTRTGIFSLYVFYYCIYRFAMFGDTPLAHNKVSGISLVYTDEFSPASMYWFPLPFKLPVVM